MHTISHSSIQGVASNCMNLVVTESITMKNTQKRHKK